MAKNKMGKGLTLSRSSTDSDWYKTIIQTLPDGFLLIKYPSRNILDVNDAFCKMLSHSREELLNTSFFELVGPEHRRFVEEYFQSKVQSDTAPEPMEISLKREDGSLVAVEMVNTIINYEDGLASLVYIRDVSYRIKAEESLAEERDRYRCLFEEVPVAIYETDFSWIKEFVAELKAKGIRDIERYFY